MGYINPVSVSYLNCTSAKPPLIVNIFFRLFFLFYNKYVVCFLVVSSQMNIPIKLYICVMKQKTKEYF